MGEKDITEKILADYNDVFADIVNVLLFHGKRVIEEDQLYNIKDTSLYKIDGAIHEQNRDVTKAWKKSGARIAIMGFEHQTDPDAYMPLRVIGYDGAAYRYQLNVDKKSQIQTSPVITLVLNFGMRRWGKKKSLSRCMKIDPRLKPYFSDYRINVIDVAYVSDEQLHMFQSDFRIVADYFVQLRKNRDYIPSKETIEHVDEVLKLMSVLTDDYRFKAAQNEKLEENTMCEVLDKVENRGITKGKAEERTRGLNSMIIALKPIYTNMDAIYQAIKATPAYSDVTMQELLQAEKLAN